MITPAGSAVLESLVAIGMVAVFIVAGLVRAQKRDTNKKDKGIENV